MILSRSAYPGQQRYGAAVWSGDIAGTWDSFRRQIPAGLNFRLTGQPYWTTDCGGFFRPKDEYTSADFNELQTRWYEFSTFCPILRIHGCGTATEIWNWLPETQKNLQAYDEFRHRMLPYTYSLAWQVTNAGSTMMRALPLDFRSDEEAGEISDEYMFGPALLVSPVTQPGVASRGVYLPRGTGWTDFWTGVTVPGGRRIDAPSPRSQIPLAVRAGSICRWVRWCSTPARSRTLPSGCASLPVPTGRSRSTRTRGMATATKQARTRRSRWPGTTRAAR